MKKIIALAALTTLAVAPLAVAQEEAGPLSWLAFNKTQSGMGQKYIRSVIQNDGPMYDSLLAEGTLLSWGIAIPINHNIDDNWNIALWATFPNWGGVTDLQTGFEGLFAERGPEKMAELQQTYQESVVPGAHHDWIVRHEVLNNGSGEKQPKYFDIGYHKAKMGRGSDLIAWYKQHIVPINDALLAEGTITGYGMYTQALHGTTEYTHVTWTTVADTADIDTTEAAFEAGLSEETYAEVIEMVETDAHRDQMLLIVHLGGTPAE